MQTDIELLKDTFNKLGIPFREEAYTSEKTGVTVTWIQMCKRDEINFNTDLLKHTFDFNDKGKLTAA